jgi:myo-inositol 2-dehydrogenase / D-chiro-inositol 1-dehydrogenase
MERPIGIGFIGCGEVGAEKHLPAVREVRELDVVAVADNDPERLRSVEDRFGIRRCHRDTGALLADPEVEVVAVCLPPRLQVAAALEALDAHKHVWIEAPIGLSLPDCDRLIAKARGSDRCVTVGFHMRWHRLVRQAKEIVDSGRLGQIQTVRATWNSPRADDTLPEWRRHRALGGGALVEVAGDHFDLWRYLLDSEITELFASTVDGRWEDEAAVVSGHMSNGVLVSAVFSERANHDLEFEICGKEGRLRVSLIRFEGLEYYSTETMPSSLPARLQRMGHFLKELPRALPRMHRAGDYRVSYCDQWREFARSIRTGTPMEATLQDGRQALAAVLAAARSSVVGRPVPLRDAPATMTLPPGKGRVQAAS